MTQIPSSLQGTNIFGKLRTLLYHLCDLSSLKSQLDIHAGIIEGYEDTEDVDVSRTISSCNFSQSSQLNTTIIFAFSLYYFKSIPFQEVYLKCKELLRMLEEKQTEPEDVSLSARASSSFSARGSLIPKTQPAPSRTNNGVHKGSWKQTSSYLARAKFGPPSSVRSSHSAHNSSRGLTSHKEVCNYHCQVLEFSKKDCDLSSAHISSTSVSVPYFPLMEVHILF